MQTAEKRASDHNAKHKSKTSRQQRLQESAEEQFLEKRRENYRHRDEREHGHGLHQLVHLRLHLRRAQHIADSGDNKWKCKACKPGEDQLIWIGHSAAQRCEDGLAITYLED